MNTKIKITAAALMVAAVAQASLTDFGLGGNTTYDGWTALNGTAYPGYGGGYPGVAPFPGAMIANEVGSNGAGLNKVAGTGYAAGGSLYSPMGGLFNIGNGSIQTDVETIVFAIEYGGSFTNGGPVLSINGSSALAADYSFNLKTEVIPAPPGSPAGPATIYTDIFQWDLSSLGDAVTSYDISYEMGEHGQQYALQLEQSDTYSQAIPEPSTIVLMSGAAVAMTFLRRKRFR